MINPQAKLLNSVSNFSDKSIGSHVIYPVDNHADKNIQSYREALESWGGRRFLKAQKGTVSHSSPAVAALLFFDIFLWVAVFGAILWLFSIFSNGSHQPDANAVLIPLGISIVCSWLVGAYDLHSDFKSLRFASEFIITGLFATALGCGFTVLLGNYTSAELTSRFMILATSFIFTIASLLLRRYLAGRDTWAISGMRHIFLIGESAEAAALENALSMAGRPASVVCHPDGPITVQSITDYLKLPIIAPRSAPGVENSQTMVAEASLGAIVLGPSSLLSLPQISPFLVSLHTTRLPVYTWSAFWSQRVRMHDVDASSTWLFQKDFRLTQTSVYWHLKRLLDIVGALTALIIFLPLLAVMWLLIRLDSPGPALFLQKRVGFRGEEFTIYKFRSMRINAEADGTTTKPGDSRITRLGHFLRRSRIDEIPQLLNVLKGDMSFIGPRPEWNVCVKEYEYRLPGYHLRHLAKPGITGWAQVNYPYGEGLSDARNKLAFDLYYVNNASLILDCSIVLKTLYVLLARVGGR